MKFPFTSLLLIALPSLALAGGIDRSGQGLGALFEEGRYIEASLSTVTPRIEGTDRLGSTTGNVGGSYTLPSASLKFDGSEKLSFALLLEQTYGANMRYGESSQLLGGTMTDEHSYSIVGLARYRFDRNISLHGGLRVQESSAHIRLKGLAFGAVNGYDMQFAPHTAISPIVGAAYEIPEIALRFAATYHSATKHQFDTRESGPLNGTSTTEVSTPQAINLDFQTGVTPSTLLFGKYRWVQWSAFKVNPEKFVAATGTGLVDLEDTRTWTLGLLQKLGQNWAGALSYDYEAACAPYNSPLAPVNGRRGVSLAAIHQQDKTRIIVSVSYFALGDAEIGTGTPPALRAQMTDNAALALGVKVGTAF